MKRFLASPYRVTLNYAFDRVIDGCANHRDEGTRITRVVMREAYRRLHELNTRALSIEVMARSGTGRRDMASRRGRLFCGRSMFSRGECL